MSTSTPAGLRQDVELGDLSPEDAPRMYRWMLDPHVSRNLGLTREPSLEYTRAWIERSGKAAEVRAFAILRDGEHVGNVVLDRIDPSSGSARFSIYVGEAEARGCGVGRTALFRLLETGFRELALDEIWLTVQPGNLAAVKIYEAVGFREQAPAPAERRSEDGAPDTITMSVRRNRFDGAPSLPQGERT